MGFCTTTATFTLRCITIINVLSEGFQIIFTGYEAGDCIAGFEGVHMSNRQVVYAWVGRHFGLNFVALAGGSSDTASHMPL